MCKWRWNPLLCLSQRFGFRESFVYISKQHFVTPKTRLPAVISLAYDLGADWPQDHSLAKVCLKGMFLYIKLKNIVLLPHSCLHFAVEILGVIHWLENHDTYFCLLDFVGFVLRIPWNTIMEANYIVLYSEKAEVAMVQNLRISQMFWNTRLCYLIPFDILLAFPEMQHTNKPH